METHYLIDYENVGSGGLTGCSKLGKTDHIHIFFTDNSKKIDMDIVHDHGEAEFITYKVPVGAQNVDMHLVSFLGYLVGSLREQACNFVIISNDKDYKDIIDFWKSRIKTRGLAVTFSQKPKLTGKSQTTKSQDSQAARSAAKNAGSQKQKLNTEIMQKLSEKGCTKELNGQVAHIVSERFGEGNFLSAVHNDLREEYDDYLAVYNAIKPILQKYVGAAAEGSENVSEKTKINNEVQQILSKAGKDGKVITEVASIVTKHVGAKNGKQQTYRAIISKFGQKEGLDLYNRIKKNI